MFQRRHGFQTSGDRSRSRRLAALQASAREAAGNDAPPETIEIQKTPRVAAPPAKPASADPMAGGSVNGVRQTGRKRSSRDSAPAVAAFRVAGEPDVETPRRGKPRSSVDETARQGVAVATLLALFRSAGIKPSEPLMSEDTPMSMPRFKRLVAQMPKIAEIVGQFQSPEMQREVLQALIRAFESDDVDAADDDDREADSDTDTGGARKPAANGRARKQTAPAFVDPAAAAALLGAEAGDDSSIHS